MYCLTEALNVKLTMCYWLWNSWLHRKSGTKGFYF